MKKLIIAAALFSLLSAAAGCGVTAEERAPEQSPAASETDTSEAEEASPKLQTPDFTVYDLDGNADSLSDHLGRPVVVNFWTAWCVPCIKELPYFEELYQEYGGEADFMMVSMPFEGNTVEMVRKAAEKHGLTFPIYYDSDLSAAEAYGIRSIPQTLFIDKNGDVVKSFVGTLSRDSLKYYLDMILE